MGKETAFISATSQPELARVGVVVPCTRRYHILVAGPALSRGPSAPGGSSASLGSRCRCLHLSLSQLSPLCVNPADRFGVYNVTGVLWAICCRDKDVLR